MFHFAERDHSRAHVRMSTVCGGSNESLVIMVNELSRIDWDAVNDLAGVEIGEILIKTM